MTKKGDFNADEWSLVLEGPPIAGLRVASAQRGGTLRESISLARAYTDARQEHGASELLDDIVSARPEMDPTRYRSVEDISGLGMERLRQAVQLLEQKASPQEVDDYKRFVLKLAEKVAHAHREGGFLGVGGKEVSDSERAALDEIAATLQVEAS